jgi:hypothetical protein
VESMVEYRNGRVDAVTMLAPVPCMADGSCPWHNLPFELDPRRSDGAILRQFATVGVLIPHYAVPSIQRGLLDARQVELDRRYGPPTWTNLARSAMTWSAPNGERVVLFLTSGDGWIVEAHLFDLNSQTEYWRDALGLILSRWLRVVADRQPRQPARPDPRRRCSRTGLAASTRRGPAPEPRAGRGRRARRS